MGRIVVLLNPLDSDDRVEHSFSGPFIDWLQVHYPNGFETPHVASFNLKRLPVEDYDTVIGEDDVLVLGIFPAAPAFFMGAPFLMSSFWAGVTSFIVGTVISIGLSYAINALFGPKGATPVAPRSFAGAGAAGSVYSLATPTNMARIGQPIQVPYGKNLIVPDQAMQPYAYYANNQQYVCQLLCIGQGEYDIEEIKVALSNVAELAEGVVEYSVWPASAHQQTFGIIQNATGIYENVYTSPEVSDQELIGDLAGGFSAPANLWNGGWATFSGGIFYINSDEPARQYVQMLKNGTPVWAVVTGGVPAGNNGSYVVGFIEGAGYTQEYNQNGDVIYAYGRKGHLGPCAEPTWTNTGTCVGPTWPAGDGTGIVTLTITPPGTGNLGAPLGPHAASPPCMLTEHLQYDIVFPNGCFKADPETGALQLYTVSVRFVAELIDNLGAALGPSYTTIWQEDLATNTPQRRTIDHYVPKGRYRVAAERTSPVSDLAQDQSKCYWAGLKAILGLYCDDSGVAEVPIPDNTYHGPGSSGEDTETTPEMLGQLANGTWVTLAQELAGEISQTVFVPSLANYNTVVVSSPSTDKETHWGCGPDSDPGVAWVIETCPINATLRANLCYVLRLRVDNGYLRATSINFQSSPAGDKLQSWVFALSRDPFKIDRNAPVDETNCSNLIPRDTATFDVFNCDVLSSAIGVPGVQMLYAKWEAADPSAAASVCVGTVDARCRMYIKAW